MVMFRMPSGDINNIRFNMCMGRSHDPSALGPPLYGYFADWTVTCFSAGLASVTGTETVRMPLS